MAFGLVLRWGVRFLGYFSPAAQSHSTECLPYFFAVLTFYPFWFRDVHFLGIVGYAAPAKMLKSSFERGTEPLARVA